MPANIPDNLARIRERIKRFEAQYEREPGSVRLLAASKAKGPEFVRAALDCGQLEFAENYLQEAQAKIAALAGAGITWHFIGPIQSNKTRQIAELFDWVHTVDRGKIAQRLHEQRPEKLPPLKVLLQVNVSNEDSKSGISVIELPELAAEVAGLSRLRLCGLMAIPAPTPDFLAQRQAFAVLRAARTTLQNLGHVSCQHLSMGMSADVEAAIAEGATMIRIGTDIFGARSPAA
ncbi:MAG: YggS family pyridoxal phosphate-dependent enzyme [Pseudomonadota bacterium]